MSTDKQKAPAAGSLPVPKMNRGLKGFYQDVMREMKHVTWPTPQETTRQTGVVMAVSVGIVLLLLVLSIVFQTVLRAIGIQG